MPADIKPRLIVSRCLGFAACRYNGQKINDTFVDMLRPLVEFVPVCAECEIGLGVPREPVRVVQQQNELRLLQPATGHDATKAMLAFCRAWLTEAGEPDGFLLKSKSPSCGISDVKIYPSAGKVPALGRGRGFFGGMARELSPEAPAEDEARLTNFRLREHWLTQVWTRARLRAARSKGTMGALVAFHAAHKYLIQTHSEKELRALGKIVANAEKLPAREVFARYAAGLTRALTTPARPTAVINVLQHMQGFAAEHLTAAEKRHFAALLEKFRAGRIPLSALTTVVQGWVVRSNLDYLAGQAFFAPYPEQLVTISDSGKGRNL